MGDPSGKDIIIIFPLLHQKGLGGGECPGKDAVNYLKRRLHHYPNCLSDFLKTCNGQSLEAVLSQITFVTRSLCDPKVSTTPCGTDLKPGSGTPDKPCEPLDICFSQFECNRDDEHRANALLFEMANWCNCKYHKLHGGEGPAEDMCKHCGFPPEWCIGGGLA